MNKLVFLLIVLPTFSFGQTLYFGFGTSHSKLDWEFNYIEGHSEKQHIGILTSFGFTGGIEYFEQKYFSFSSELSFFKSGGKRGESENTEIQWSKGKMEINSLNNLSLGSYISFVPLNNKFKVQLSLGPRVDILLTERNSRFRNIEDNGDLNKINFGLTGGLGIYYCPKKVTYGLRGQYLSRTLKLADYKPTEFRAGVVASDRIFLTTFVIGFNLTNSKKN